jgi:single-stranded DNA-binding protein
MARQKGLTKGDPMVNKAILIGIIVKEVLCTRTDRSMVAKFSLKTWETYKENTHFTYHNIDVWGESRAQWCADNLIVGSLVEVVGRIENRSYMKGTERKYISCVAANEVKITAAEPPERGRAPEQPAQQQQPAQPASGEENQDMQDDSGLPF